MVSMFQATQAAGAVPLARLAWNEPWLIMRALDLGAVGVILPLIDNAVEARRAWSPAGIRRWASARTVPSGPSS